MGGATRGRAGSGVDGAPIPSADAHEENDVGTPRPAGGYVIANGIDRDQADELRRRHDDVVVSRNLDGTYRVTRNTRDKRD